ncbi:MAG: hypothetical protein Q4P06_05555 [Actinomycetaceae bacterium]|nr:hypothetical protein [Actinomycetaceae bacterium]
MITVKQRWGLFYVLLQFATVFLAVSLTGVVGWMLTERNFSQPVPALLKLRDPHVAVAEIIIPMVVAVVVTAIFVRTSHLRPLVWREPEYVSPELGGKAPTYAPPIDTGDDLLLGSALSTEPEPFYDLHVQPQISRLWWLLGMLIVLGAGLAIIYGIAHAHVTGWSLAIGMFAAFMWAFAHEYLLRGLLVARVRRFTRRDRVPLLVSATLSALWIIPFAVTANTPTRTLLLLLAGPILAVPLFALRRMFTTLWAPIFAHFLLITAFFVLV